jgi:hypothetical protein
MKAERIEDILDRCLERIAAGEDASACLRDEPQHADTLAPLLRAAVELRGWEPPRLPDATRRAARAAAHATLARQSKSNARRPAIRSLSLWRFAIAVAVVVAMLSVGTVNTTMGGRSLPGDTLYTWKRAKEQITLALATNPGQRAQLHTEIAARRLQELEFLVDTGHAVDSAVVDEILSSLLEHAERAIEENGQAPEVSVAPMVSHILAETRKTIPQIAALAQGAALEAVLAALEVEQLSQEVTSPVALTEVPISLPPSNTPARPTNTLRPTDTGGCAPASPPADATEEVVESPMAVDSSGLTVTPTNTPSLPLPTPTDTPTADPSRALPPTKSLAEQLTETPAPTATPIFTFEPIDVPPSPTAMPAVTEEATVGTAEDRPCR